MKNITKIFTTLFLALTVMPVQVFADGCDDLATKVFDKCSDIVIDNTVSAKRAKCMQKTSAIDPEIIGPMYDVMSKQISDFAAEIRSKPWIRIENVAKDNKDKILPTLRQKCQEVTSSQQTSTPAVSSTQTKSKKDLCAEKKGKWDGVSICYCNGKAINNLSDTTSKCEQSAEKVTKDAKTTAETQQYTTKTDNSKDVIEKIKAQNNVVLGSSISIPNALLENNSVDNAHSEWEQKCTKLSNEEYSTDIDEKKNGNNTSFTCIIQTCKKEGFKVSANKKSCEKTSEQKKADKATEKGKEIETERKRIEEASKSIKLGDKITFKKDFEDDFAGIITTWKANCKTADISKIDKAKDKEAKRTVLLPNVTYTCELSECEDGFEPDAKGLKCEKTSEQKKEEKAADKAYSKEIDELIADYKQIVEKLTADCKKQGGTLTEDGCETKPQKEQKNGDK